MKMLKFEEIESLVFSYLELLTVSTEGLLESRERAAKFLEIQAILVACLREIMVELSKLDTIKEATFANAIVSVEGKNVTEKKILVAKDSNYSSIREMFEQLESFREWIKGHIRIFENAHILYRSFSRESN